MYLRNPITPLRVNLVSSDHSPQTLSRCFFEKKGRICRMLGIDKDILPFTGNDSFGVSTAIIGTNDLPNLSKYGLSLNKSGGHNQIINGFRFSHCFIDCDSKIKSLGTLLLDEIALEKTRETIGDSRFSELIKFISLLLQLVSHDYTIHNSGMFVSGVGDEIDEILSEKILNLTSKTLDTPELLAFQFHRDILRKLGFYGEKNMEIFMRKVDAFLSGVSLLDDIQLKGYWLSVFRYLFFMIFDYNLPVVQDILNNSGFDIHPVFWQTIIHQDEMMTKSGGLIAVTELRQKVFISYREFFQGNDPVSILSDL